MGPGDAEAGGRHGLGGWGGETDDEDGDDDGAPPGQPYADDDELGQLGEECAVRPGPGDPAADPPVGQCKWCGCPRQRSFREQKKRFKEKLIFGSSDVFWCAWCFWEGMVFMGVR